MMFIANPKKNALLEIGMFHLSIKRHSLCFANILWCNMEQ